MADETVTRPSLETVAHAQSDVLWDVIALVEGARKTPFENQGESGDRLLRQALDKLHSVQAAFDGYI